MLIVWPVPCVPTDPLMTLLTGAFSFFAFGWDSITIFFFAREGFDCSPTSMDAASLPKPFTVAFKEGLGQRFRQPPGSGINFSMFEEAELLLKAGETEVYPLAVKAEASPSGEQHHQGRKAHVRNSLITQAAFEKKDNGGYQVRVIKQILWVDDTRYELQEIYGIGNSVDGDFDGNDPGKECVICLSEPRDTTVLPCRHMVNHSTSPVAVLTSPLPIPGSFLRSGCRAPTFVGGRSRFLLPIGAAWG